MTDDMLSAMVQDSKGWADPLVESYTGGNRLYQVVITRPGAASSFDRASGVFTNPEDETVYEGRARIYPVSGSSVVTVGDEMSDLASVRISIDQVVEMPPRMEDLVTVVDDAAAQAGHLAERQFTVTDVEVGGFFTYGWTLTGVGVAPSRRTG